MKEFNIKISLVAILFLVSIFSGCKKDAKDEITIGYLPIIAHLPAAIAKKDGQFENIKTNFVVYASSNDLLNDLQSGKIDVATTIAVPPIIEFASDLRKDGEGVQFEIFSYSETTLDEPFDGVFVKPGSPINSLADLKEKKIGVFPGNTAQNIFSHLLETQYQIGREENTWVRLPPPAQLDALENGDIDALFTYETMRTVVETRGFKKIHGSVVASLLDKAPYGCSAINSDFKRSSPNLAQQFINGFDLGIDAVRNSPEKARSALITELGVSSDVAESCNLEKRLKSTELSTNQKVFQEFISMIYTAEGLNSEGGMIDTSDLLLDSGD